MINQTEIEFSRNLIKGKIAEVIFEQMMREEKRYTIIPFGYEHTMPMLAHYQHLVEIKHIIKNISEAPDFVLISEDKSKLFLVEIKYQSKLNIDKLKDHANKLLGKWCIFFLLASSAQKSLLQFYLLLGFLKILFQF